MKKILGISLVLIVAAFLYFFGLEAPKTPPPAPGPQIPVLLTPQNELMLAIEKGDIEAVRRIGPVAVEGEKMPLVLKVVTVAQRNQSDPKYVAILEAVIAAGYDVNAGSANPETKPLTAAAFAGHTSIVKALLQAKANPNVSDAWGGTPYRYAVRHGDEEMKRLLLEAGAAPDFMPPENPLIAAARANDLKRARELVAGQAAVNVMDASGSTPYDYAERNGNQELKVLLLQAGADVRLKARLEAGFGKKKQDPSFSNVKTSPALPAEKR